LIIALSSRARKAGSRYSSAEPRLGTIGLSPPQYRKPTRLHCKGLGGLRTLASTA
jgi:hypothetical protein